MSAAPVSFSPRKVTSTPHAVAPELVEAVSGLAVAALSHAIAAIVSRRYQADPSRILPALRPTPEELVFAAPLLGMLLSALPRRARLAVIGGVLALWFVSRIALAVEAARIAESLKPAPWWKRIATRISFWR
jgi:hypothetical protein